jgi:hypothetical protein
MDQLTMFDLFQPSAAPRGSVELVAADQVHSILRLTNPQKKRQEWARIELHPFEEKWMWAVSHSIGGRPVQGYPVGAKWGRFAPSIEEALAKAVQELRTDIEGYRLSKSKRAVIDWLGMVDPRPEAVGK